MDIVSQMDNLDLSNQKLSEALVDKVEAKIAKLENAKYCITTNSGVSSISIVLQLLGSKAKILV